MATKMIMEMAIRALRPGCRDVDVGTRFCAAHPPYGSSETRYRCRGMTPKMLLTCPDVRGCSSDKLYTSKFPPLIAPPTYNSVWALPFSMRQASWVDYRPLFTSHAGNTTLVLHAAHHSGVGHTTCPPRSARTPTSGLSTSVLLGRAHDDLRRRVYLGSSPQISPRIQPVNPRILPSHLTPPHPAATTSQYLHVQTKVYRLRENSRQSKVAR